MTGPSLEDEVTFLIGVDQFNKVAATAAATWKASSSRRATTPSRTRQSGATRRPARAPPSAISSPRRRAGPTKRRPPGKAAWSCGRPLPTSPSPRPPATDAANFKITRGADRSGAVRRSARDAQPLDRRRHDPARPAATGSVVSIDTTVDDCSARSARHSRRSGGHPLSTVVHELGHIIGIGHGGPYNADINPAGPAVQRLRHDAVDTDVVHQRRRPREPSSSTSYPVKGTSWGSDGRSRRETFSFNNEPLTPMMLDILAVQRLYGVATSGPLTGGGHTFGFNSQHRRATSAASTTSHINTATPSSRSGSNGTEQHARPVGLLARCDR